MPTKDLSNRLYTPVRSQTDVGTAYQSTSFTTAGTESATNIRTTLWTTAFDTVSPSYITIIRTQTQTITIRLNSSTADPIIIRTGDSPFTCDWLAVTSIFITSTAATVVDIILSSTG